MVQHLYQTTLDRINQLSDEDRIPDSRKAEIYNLFLTLQELGDKKVELTRAIKQTFGKQKIFNPKYCLTLEIFNHKNFW